MPKQAMEKAPWESGAPRLILLATDLSCRCDRALDRAVLLAQSWKARSRATRPRSTSRGGR